MPRSNPETATTASWARCYLRLDSVMPEMSAGVKERDRLWDALGIDRVSMASFATSMPTAIFCKNWIASAISRYRNPTRAA